MPSAATFNNGTGKASQVVFIKISDRELALGDPLGAEPSRGNVGHFLNAIRNLRRLHDAEGDPVAFGGPENLPRQLAGMSLEREAIEMNVCFLPEFEQAIAAVVQQRDPVDRNLIEERTTMDVGGKGKK